MRTNTLTYAIIVCAVALCFALDFLCPASAADSTPAPAAAEHGGKMPAVTAGEIDHAIESVLSRPEYSWRLRREVARAKDEREPSGFWNAFWRNVGDIFDKASDWVGRQLGRLARWLKDFFPKPVNQNREPNSIDWQESIRVLMFVLLALVASLLGVLIYRLWRHRRRSREVKAEALPATIDIRDENVVASQLPSDEWMNLARDLMNKGEWRLAMRAMFLAALAALAHRGNLTVARYKSNREYRRELERKAHDQPDILQAFSQNVLLLESVWYGMHPATADMVELFRRNQESILSRLQEPTGGAAKP